MILYEYSTADKNIAGWDRVRLDGLGTTFSTSSSPDVASVAGRPLMLPGRLDVWTPATD
jgi:hypothetical protein